MIFFGGGGRAGGLTGYVRVSTHDPTIKSAAHPIQKATSQPIGVVSSNQSM